MQYVDSSGKVFKNPLILKNGARCYNPSHEMLTAYGYVRKDIAPAPVPPRPRVYRFSKLAVIRALGDSWAQKKQELIDAGIYDQFENATYLATDDPMFAPSYKSLTPEERLVLIKNCRY